MAYGRICDVCKARGKVQTFAIAKGVWKNGPRVDVCKVHEDLLHLMRNWQGWQVGQWLASGCPVIGSNEKIVDKIEDKVDQTPPQKEIDPPQKVTVRSMSGLQSARKVLPDPSQNTGFLQSVANILIRKK